jgi:hypothetical protein
VLRGQRRPLRIVQPRCRLGHRRPAVERGALQVPARQRPDPPRREQARVHQVGEHAFLVVLQLRERVDPAQRRVARRHRPRAAPDASSPSGPRRSGRSATGRRPAPAARARSSARASRSPAGAGRGPGRAGPPPGAAPRPSPPAAGSARPGCWRSSRITSTRASISRSISRNCGVSRRLPPDGLSPFRGASHESKSNTRLPRVVCLEALQARTIPRIREVQPRKGLISRIDQPCGD